MPTDNSENPTVASIKNPSLAKRSRNLGIVAMSLMIGINIMNFNWQMQWYSYAWAFGVFMLALLAGLVLSIIGFVMGINALREEIDRLTASLGLVLNGVAFLPLCFLTSLLGFSRG